MLEYTNSVSFTTGEFKASLCFEKLVHEVAIS